MCFANVSVSVSVGGGVGVVGGGVCVGGGVRCVGVGGVGGVGAGVGCFGVLKKTGIHLSFFWVLSYIGDLAKYCKDLSVQ